jgi:hypothetical protein
MVLVVVLYHRGEKGLQFYFASQNKIVWHSALNNFCDSVAKTVWQESCLTIFLALLEKQTSKPPFLHITTS